jgi:putative endonuclease
MDPEIRPSDPSMALYVYILRCADGKLYTGITNDPTRRLFEHQSGAFPDAFTYRRRPVAMVFCLHFPDGTHPEAIQFEKQLKGWRKEKKEAVIAGRWQELPELARCRNLTHHANAPDQREELPFDSAQGKSPYPETSTPLRPEDKRNSTP